MELTDRRTLPRNCPENKEVAEAHTSPRPPSPQEVAEDEMTASRPQFHPSRGHTPAPEDWRSDEQTALRAPRDRGRQVRVRQGPAQTPNRAGRTKIRDGLVPESGR